MSISIQILEDKKRKIQNSMNNARKELDECEEAYDSLVAFKREVNTAFETFNSVNTKKQEILDSLSPYCKYNGCVKRYCNDLKHFLNKHGFNTIGSMYKAFLENISNRMKKYYKKAEKLNDLILMYRDQIDDIQAEINYIELNSIKILEMEDGN